MTNASITLVELPATAFGRLNGKPAEDVYCGFRLPARAIPLLHAILVNERFTDVASVNPLFNEPAGRLRERDMERILGSDFLLISAITRTIPQSRELGLLYRERNPRGTIIVGGPHATNHAEECLEWADIVVRQEGDRTLPALLRALIERGSPDGIDGISYRRGGEIARGRPAAPLTEDELSRLPDPHYDEGTARGVWVWPVATSRGCPRRCDFCSVSSLYGPTYRRRSNESIAGELERLKRRGAGYVFFTDDNFAGRPEETRQLLRMMIDRRLNSLLYLCQLCVSAAFDAELLSLLARAGVSIVFVGIESLSEETLRSLNKKVDAERNKAAVRLFRKAGMWVHGMMMIGGDGDTEQSLAETAEWARHNLDSVQYFTPTPLAGTRFGEAMRREGRILTDRYYLYDGQHVVLRPAHFTPYRLQKIIFDMYREFYSLRESVRTAVKSACALKALYPLRKMLLYLYVKRVLARAFRNPQLCAHMGWLRGISRAVAAEGAE